MLLDPNQPALLQHTPKTPPRSSCRGSYLVGIAVALRSGQGGIPAPFSPCFGTPIDPSPVTTQHVENVPFHDFKGDCLQNSQPPHRNLRCPFPSSLLTQLQEEPSHKVLQSRRDGTWNRTVQKSSKLEKSSKISPCPTIGPSPP